MQYVFRPIFSIFVVLLVLGACGRDNPTLVEPTDSTEALSVKITSPEQGEQIGGNVLVLKVEAEGIIVAEPDGDASGEIGHFHAFIDREPVAPGETISDDPAVVHFAANTFSIPGLAIGKHKITVVLGDGTEARMGRVSDEVEIEITGPAIDATAPATAPMATGFTVQTTATGVELVDPARDPGQGATGHLDFIIDPEQEPTADGRPVPEDASHLHTTGGSAQVTGLEEGDHVIWVVLTDKDHVPVSPMVADKLVVSIR